MHSNFFNETVMYVVTRLRVVIVLYNFVRMSPIDSATPDTSQSMLSLTFRFASMGVQGEVA